MTIEIGENRPLMVVTLPKEKTLQKESTGNLPSPPSQVSALPDERVELESDSSWQKGRFVDVYI